MFFYLDLSASGVVLDALNWIFLVTERKMIPWPYGGTILSLIPKQQNKGRKCTIAVFRQRETNITSYYWIQQMSFYVTPIDNPFLNSMIWAKHNGVEGIQPILIVKLFYFLLFLLFCSGWWKIRQGPSGYLRIDSRYSGY